MSWLPALDDGGEVSSERPLHLAASLLEGARALDGMLCCELCSYSTLKFALMQRHLRSHRNQKASLPCVRCGKVLGSKRALQNHLLVHERPFRCETCGKTYAQAVNLRTHQRHHSTKADPVERQSTVEDKNFVCDTCGKRFGSQTNLSIHEKRHSEGKKFRCEFCSKTFFDNATLKAHLRIHTGELPYVCNTCGKGFTQRTTLTVHEKEKHSDERPFKCELCSEAFALNWKLKAHLRVHTGERPFVCGTCGEAFDAKVRLSRHEKSRHSLEPSSRRTSRRTCTIVHDSRIDLPN